MSPALWWRLRVPFFVTESFVPFSLRCVHTLCGGLCSSSFWCSLISLPSIFQWAVSFLCFMVVVFHTVTNIFSVPLHGSSFSFVTRSLMCVSFSLDFCVAWQRDDSQDVSDTLNTWNVTLFLVIDSRGRTTCDTRKRSWRMDSRASCHLTADLLCDHWTLDVRSVRKESSCSFVLINFSRNKLRPFVPMLRWRWPPTFLCLWSQFHFTTWSLRGVSDGKVIGVPGLVDFSFEIRSLHSEMVSLENVENVSRSPKEV